MDIRTKGLCEKEYYNYFVKSLIKCISDSMQDAENKSSYEDAAMGLCRVINDLVFVAIEQYAELTK